MTLRRRVEILESKSGVDDTGGDIFVEFVGPGVERDMYRISTREGQVWLRRDNEKPEQLKERAKSEAPQRAPNGVRLFFCDSNVGESSSKDGPLDRV